MRIREYRSEDFNALWRLDQECFPPGIAYTRFELMHYIRRRGAFTLIVEDEDERIAAFIVCECRAGVRHEADGPNRIGHIMTIDVAGRGRRKGIGTLLMQASEKRMREGGCKAVYLETAVDNVAAIEFYKKHGYSVLSVIPRYYEGKLDAFMMGKSLNSTEVSPKQMSRQSL